VKVAALMTEEIIRRRVTIPADATRVILPMISSVISAATFTPASAMVQAKRSGGRVAAIFSSRFAGAIVLRGPGGDRTCRGSLSERAA
jgi:CO dehydrogenase/acetyl-CoA synthase gamma subunit (corrinoid Fe-S protein)